MGLVQEFKEFALKGNVMDLAVGIIIGGAFGKIVTSLVNDIVMPVVGLMIGGTEIGKLKYVITPANEITKVPESAIRYGMFLSTCLDFLIVALSIFAVIKAMNTLRRMAEAQAARLPFGKKEIITSDKPETK